MGLYKRPESTSWQYKFTIDGTTFRGSCNTSVKRTAEEVMREAWVKAKAELAEGKAPVRLIPDLSKIGEWDIKRAKQAGRNETYVERALVPQWRTLSEYFEVLKNINDESLAEYVQKRKQEVSGQTVLRELTLLRRGMGYAARKNYIAGTVLTSIEWPAVKKSPKKKSQAGAFLPPDQLLPWLAELHGEASDQAWFAVLTGMRCEEMKRLRDSHIAYAKGACIPAYLDLPAEATKNKHPRMVGLVPFALHIARRYPEGFKQEHKTAFRMAARRVGMQRNPHLRDLRHTFATLADACNDVRGIAQVMGHTKDVPSLYSHQHVERIGKIAQTVAQALGIANYK